MEEIRYDVKTVKDMLAIYLEKEEDIDNEIERLEYLEYQLTAAGVQNLTAMPRNPSPSTDRLADAMQKKQDIEDGIRLAISEQNEFRKWIEKIISHIKSEERMVIRLKYIDRIKWSEVLRVLFSRKTDFEDKKESYERRMHRIHSSALVNMAKYLQESDEKNEYSKFCGL